MRMIDPFLFSSSPSVGDEAVEEEAMGGLTVCPGRIGTGRSIFAAGSK